MARILVLYHSQEYGNTHAMAEAVAAGAKSAGAEVTLVNTNEQRLDIESYRACDAVALGSPDYYSYIAGGLKVFFDDWHIAKGANADGLTDKPCGLFYSHGGGGKVRPVLETLGGKLGPVQGEPVESRGAPDPDVLASCKALGKQLADAC